MASSVLISPDTDDPIGYNPFENDPPARTRYEVVADTSLFRLRHYEPEERDAGRLPVVFVYSLFKRPYILDLENRRSVVRCFLDRGLSVYLVDWHPPGAGDSWRGLDAYVNDGLASAVERVREREHVDQVSLIGICFGGLLALLYAALHPESVAHLVQVAVGIERQRIIPPVVIEQMIGFYGNLPAWWIRNTMNGRVPPTPLLPQYLAEELDEPELAQPRTNAANPLFGQLEFWLNSDVPLSGQLARDILCDVYWDGKLADGRLEVGGQRIELERVHCPVLNISGARDRLVPPQSTARLVEHVGSAYARNFVFPVTHIGLLGAQASHDELWPRVCTWLKIID